MAEKAEDLNGAKRGAGCLGLLLIIIGLMVIGFTGDAGFTLGAIITFAGGLCWLAAIIFGVIAKSGTSKMAQAIESLRLAHNAGLELRQMMGILGLLEEALRQSEAESNIAEVMEDVSKALAKGNIFDGAHSAAFCLIQASAYAEIAASLWEKEDLTSKVSEPHKDMLAAALKETSKLFNEAATALSKARESL